MTLSLNKSYMLEVKLSTGSTNTFFMKNVIIFCASKNQMNTLAYYAPFPRQWNLCLDQLGCFCSVSRNQKISANLSIYFFIIIILARIWIHLSCLDLFVIFHVALKHKSKATLLWLLSTHNQTHTRFNAGVPVSLVHIYPVFIKSEQQAISMSQITIATSVMPYPHTFTSTTAKCQTTPFCTAASLTGHSR